MAFTRRAALVGVGAALGVIGTRALAPDRMALAGAGIIDAGSDTATSLNDASLLSRIPVSSHITLADAGPKALVEGLRAELAEAAGSGRAVAIGAARHSMGGQSIPQGGQAVTLDMGSVFPAEGAFACTAGARWRDVIATLDPVGLAPKVMQSNNDFGVAATFCVNAHGWATPHGPMGATVRSVGMMLADGQVLRASRTENAEVFRAAMGGYGLIGLITDLEVEAAPNLLMEPTFTEMPAEDFASAFEAAMTDAVPMAYGRLNIDRGGVLRDAMLVTYAPVEGEVPPASGSGWLSQVSRPIFRAQLGSDPVKRLRWGIETGIGARLAGPATRNSLFNEPVVTLADRDPARTDILHEYFVPPGGFGDFLTAARAILPSSYQDLLNITLRWVAQDSESLLAYAPDGPRIAAVLLFAQEMTARAEADMARMTREMIDAVTALGGSYYLPYRLHATPAQFVAAYPRAAEFAALKRRHDPRLTLRNALWDRYLATL